MNEHLSDSYPGFMYIIRRYRRIFRFSTILRYDGEIHADDLTKALLHSGIEERISIPMG